MQVQYNVSNVSTIFVFETEENYLNKKHSMCRVDSICDSKTNAILQGLRVIMNVSIAKERVL